ncbi:MAG: glycine oxidase ThiO [Rhizobiaceae bacterium MnEN-MB40S]|nr:MAG: glycine oxidase ThiO [Rhizobiaceae bacterium MnEN-MB40S]
MTILIKGAGVAGLALAAELARRGVAVSVTDPEQSPLGNASSMAGGMLAPWCERASAEEEVLTWGRHAADWWDDMLPGEVTRNGTLVVAPGRDRAELARFAERTSGHAVIDADRIAELEPDLAGRFRQALFFEGEAHLDPRRALPGLVDMLKGRGVRFHFGEALRAYSLEADCTGFARAADDPELRGVRGEMLILRTAEISLSRPVRLLHPRFPVYVAPRQDNCFMVGATMIESSRAGPVSVRSMMELMNAAYSLHPAFGEAEVVETGVGVRPAYPDNLPRVKIDGGVVSVNGLYRHGFLLAPAMARQAADLLCEQISGMELRNGTHG